MDAQLLLMTISGQPSKTDWDRVRRSIETDEPIPYDPNDPEDGPLRSQRRSRYGSLF